MRRLATTPASQHAHRPRPVQASARALPPGRRQANPPLRAKAARLRQPPLQPFQQESDWLEENGVAASAGWGVTCILDPDFDHFDGDLQSLIGRTPACLQDEHDIF